MAHARRKFEHASENNPAMAQKALGMFRDLYEIEEKARSLKLPHDLIRELRQIESRPILDKMEQWMKEQIVETVPRSAIGMAFAYTLSLWPRLVRYIDEGRFQIDNNLIENSIRPVAMGRKAYLFAGSHQAAQNAAVMYSLLGTCKINGMEPFAYLTKTLAGIPDHKANQLHTLLPGQK